MIKKIRLMLEYNTYCIWLYNEKDEVIDNDNPPEWNDDQELTNAFMAVSDLYDSFFIDTEKEFKYIGCPNAETKEHLQQLIDKAIAILVYKNAGKYIIQNDIYFD